MTVEEARNYIEENWSDFIEELIEENLELLLEHEGISEDEIEDKYSCFDDLPQDLACSIRERQETHVMSNMESYAEWLA